MPLDLVIRGGTIYDGSGGPPRHGDVTVQGERISSVGETLSDERLAGIRTVIDATGLAVAPGFINMLSHAYYTILHDPRSLGELVQGVTTQIFGEGWSMGPLTPQMQQLQNSNRGALDYEVTWLRLSEYLTTVEKRGCTQNVASYIGATTLRSYAVGLDDRPADRRELDVMRGLVAEEMADGALGIGTALIYPPGCFASTDELVELCEAAAPFEGRYISHLRSEAEGFLDALDELLEISERAGVPAEVYHLKAAGRANWPKMDAALQKIEEARAAGRAITADVYTYDAGATGLASAIPPRYHDGGPSKLYERLEDPTIRTEIREAILHSTDGWENLYLASGGADGVLILATRREENRRFQGRRLADVAQELSMDPVDALMELVRRDRSRIGTAYFIISEDNLRKQIRRPWVSFGSDSGSMAPEGAFLQSHTHPRAYGTFARVLGRYVRDEQVLTLQEAVRRLSSLPADNLGLHGRGRLDEGYFADIVVFDPATVRDHATYEEPHQLADGMRDVVVNGVPALRNGVHTGAFPGRALHGRGRRR